MTGSRSSSEGAPHSAPPGFGTEVLAGAAIATTAAAAALLGTGPLCIVVAVAAGVSAAALAGGFEEEGLTASPTIYATGAVLFPLSAYLWGQPGLAAAVAALIFVAAVRWILARTSRQPVLAIAAFVLSSLYLGFCSSYLVLLRRAPQGGRLVIGLIIIGVLYHAGRWAGDAYLRGRPLAPHLGKSPTVPGTLVGLLGSVIGATILLALLHIHVKPRPVLEIGTAVGTALTLGVIGWDLLRPERLPPQRSAVPGRLLALVQGVLVAAPALFYAVRLALRWV